jgi:xanthine dehydrogenase accessory factor
VSGAGGKAQSVQGEFASIARELGRGALVTVIRGPNLGAKMLVRVDGSTEGSLGSDELDRVGMSHADELMWAERSEQVPVGETLLFVDVVFPAPRLVIFGAIDFAAQLCTLARVSGWVPYVSDPRGFFARKDRFPDAEEVFVGWPDKTFDALGGIDRAMSIAVLTHDPKLDDAALEIALRSDAAYVGAMGSHRMQAKRHDRLVAKGITDDELARLAAPIGLDLGALTPEETALSIMSEIVALRRGRPGGRLSHASGRIHEVTGETGEVAA